MVSHDESVSWVIIAGRFRLRRLVIRLNMRRTKWDRKPPPFPGARFRKDVLKHDSWTLLIRIHNDLRGHTNPRRQEPLSLSSRAAFAARRSRDRPMNTEVAARLAMKSDGLASVFLSRAGRPWARGQRATTVAVKE